MKGNIDKIILSILNGTATKSETDYFASWIDEDEVNQITFDQIKKYWTFNQNESEIINEDDVKDKIWAKAIDSNKQNSRKILPLIYRTAAVIVFLFSFAFLIKTLLISPANDVKAIKFNIIEKKNLAGVKSKIHLPDGSFVYLNAESSIKFIEGFKDSVRWVELIGEAYFEIARDPEKSFIVTSRDVITKALGTAFNINAYAENSSVKISLVKGKIEVKSSYNKQSDKITYLEPGQSITFQDKSILKFNSFNAENVLGWKDGIILFENANFNTVAKKLERWYGVKIKLEGAEPKWNLDARFKDASLEKIMEVLSHSEKFEYQLLGDTLKIITK